MKSLSEVFLQLSSDAAQKLFHLDDICKIQIAKTVQEKFRFGLKAGLKIDMEVLGLSLFPFLKNWQVRHGDQP